MTREDALIKAVELLGVGASVHEIPGSGSYLYPGDGILPPRWVTPGSIFCVQDPHGRTRGIGGSWETALKDAERGQVYP